MEVALAIMPGFIWHILFARKSGLSLKTGVWEFLAPVLLASVGWFFIACICSYYFPNSLNIILDYFQIDNLFNANDFSSDKPNQFLIINIVYASFISLFAALLCMLNPFIYQVVDKIIEKNKIEEAKSWYSDIKQFYLINYIIILVLLFIITSPLRIINILMKEITRTIYSYTDREFKTFLTEVIKKNTEDKNSGVMIVLSNNHFYIGKVLDADLDYSLDGNGVIQIITLASGVVLENGESVIRTTYNESHKLNRLIFIREIITIKDFVFNQGVDVIKEVKGPIEFTPNFGEKEIKIEDEVDPKKVMVFGVAIALLMIAVVLIIKGYILIGLIILIIHLIGLILLNRFKLSI